MSTGNLDDGLIALKDGKMVTLRVPYPIGFYAKGFDGRGNYTLGVTEQIIFPEIDIDKVNKITGMDITFVTTAGTNEEAYELLKEMGMPFRKKECTK